MSSVPGIYCVVSLELFLFIGNKLSVIDPGPFKIFSSNTIVICRRVHLQCCIPRSIMKVKTMFFFKDKSHLFWTFLMKLIYKVHLKFITVIINFISILISMIASAASISFEFKIPSILLWNLTLTLIENPQTLILKIRKI